MQLIDALFDGPLDIVGDVHGEIEGLESLLSRLGYAGDGSHAEGRRLVFVGDLVDRGPDSPAVVGKVAGLVDAGRAQCILGNHELNLLRGSVKNDNGWWFPDGIPTEYPAVLATDGFRADATGFFEKLPLALERDDLRVVHASWHDESVNELRESTATVREIFDSYSAAVSNELMQDGTEAEKLSEKTLFGDRIRDRSWQPRFLPAHARSGERKQMGNPVKVITSGQEAPTQDPFWAGGKWRMLERQLWWDSYKAPQAVVMGHYWRRYEPSMKQLADKYGPDLFAGTEPNAWMGRRANVFCVDFSVGARCWTRRHRPGETVCKLAAIRVPEWQVIFDDGEAWNLPPPEASRSAATTATT